MSKFAALFVAGGRWPVASAFAQKNRNSQDGTRALSRSAKTPWPQTTGHRPHRSRQLFLGAVFVIFALAAVGEAQVVRTFVSTTGSDMAPCSRTEPCRTFGTAIAAVDNEGEVVPLDSGGYGPFVVNRSVSVIAPAGIHAAIAPTASAAVSVTAATGDEVVLRGLYLNSQGGSTGISYTSGGMLHVENLIISGFTTLGISAIRPSPGQDGELFLSDSIVRGGGTGVFLSGVDSTGHMKAMIDNCRLESNVLGMQVESYAYVVMVRSVVSANGNGVRVTVSSPAPAAVAELTLERCILSNNAADGLATSTSAGSPQVWISGSTVTDNNVGIRWAGGGGGIRTMGNNTVTGNLTSNVIGGLAPRTAL